MRVMVIVKASPESEAGVMPDTEMLTAMGRYNEELVTAGVLLAGEGLHPSVRGKRVRFTGADRTVTDGPFSESADLVAGFWIWRVGSMDEAVEWARRCPNPMPGGGELELRPVFETDDFGAELTPELRAHEARLRAQAGDRCPPPARPLTSPAPPGPRCPAVSCRTGGPAGPRPPTRPRPAP